MGHLWERRGVEIAPCPPMEAPAWRRTPQGSVLPITSSLSGAIWCPQLCLAQGQTFQPPALQTSFPDEDDNCHATNLLKSQKNLPVECSRSIREDGPIFTPSGNAEITAVLTWRSTSSRLSQQEESHLASTVENKRSSRRRESQKWKVVIKGSMSQVGNPGISQHGGEPAALHGL